MKICQIMLNAGFGGAERIFVDTCIGLADAGQEIVAVVHPNFVAKNLLVHKNIELCELAVWSRYGLISKFRLALLLRKFKPDIIHVHLRKGLAVLGLLANWLGIPVVATMHNYGKVSAYTRANQIIALTSGQVKHIVDGGYSKDQIEVIPNFSQIEVLSKPRNYQKPKRFLAFGRFVKKKGFAELIDAVALAKTKGASIHLSIGGSGELEFELKTQVIEKGLQDQIKFLGWVDDVKQLLDDHDIFVLPSLSEPFGIVLLEAMARKLPVISTLSEGPKDFLDNDLAWLCQPGSVAELADCLSLASKADDSTLQARVDQGSKLISEQFSEAVVIPKLIDVYKKVTVYSH